MGDLFFNKVAGAIIGIGLIIMGLMELSNHLVHSETPESLAYTVDLSATVAVAAAEEEEEAGPVDFGLLLASADISAGERVARRCASCHTFDDSRDNRTGPYMWDVMGRAVAAVDGYGYSGAMEEYSEGGAIAWGFQNMYDYLERPAAYVPGTAMSFAGLRDQADRINIIAYMRTLSDNPIDLPAPLAAAAEVVEEAAAEITEAVDAAETAVEEVVEDAGDAPTEDDSEG
jgi:cytochrome c